MSNIIAQLPIGARSTQPTITPTTSAQTTTLSNSARGVRLTATGLAPAVTTAAVFVYVCFDAPNTGTLDNWLTDTNAGPRIAIPVNGSPVEINFNGSTVSSISYKLSAADATALLQVEAIL